MRSLASVFVAAGMLLGPALVPDGRSAGVVHADAPAEMAPRDVGRWLEFFDKLVDTVVHDEMNCDKMAADVNTLMDANRDAIAIARNAKAQGKKLPPDAKQRMVDGVKKMIPGMQHCGTNDKVRTAFSKLDLDRRD